jgi:hypothetical protein
MKIACRRYLLSEGELVRRKHRIHNVLSNRRVRGIWTSERKQAKILQIF